ncbi:dihydropyrimidinase [Anaerosalibacter massiliensis]|uniref:Dihydropyrimidinase n=1 Tax=Anaerosalibacter massiliensis TaxID=1347392 RepID=A0A9X2MG22_9FIRM|nr:dihydropyrimidinase [Anaerosalibacter massiliensis]MCR2042979.1 dihydropyrimidinase [Anaerosalibacter massiliensis]
MTTIIKGGKIVTASDAYYADLKIDNGKIISIGENLYEKDSKKIDATNCYIFPGAIDPHTHFDLEVGNAVTADDFESGTKAAIIGGTTTIIDFVNHNKGETLNDALNNWKRKAEGKTYCDYGFHMTISEWNENISDEMKDMIDKGIPSFKMYMAYKERLQVDDDIILKALKRSKEIGGLIEFHCENGDMIDFLIEEEKTKEHFSPKFHPISRPNEVEKEAVSRLISLAKVAGQPIYIVHLSTKEALKETIEAKKEGQEIYVETCPQYLLLDDSLYEDENSKNFEVAKYVLSPPLRKKVDIKALWNGLKNNYIDIIATDHCSFNYNGQKTLGKNDFSKIPNGIPGVEHRFLLMYNYGVLTDKISINQLVDLTSTNAAKIFGLYPRKGTIAVGSDADIVIWNPNHLSTITAKNQTHKVDYTPYEGFKIKGRVEHVFLRGHHIVKHSKLDLEESLGRFVYREPFKGR